MTMATNQMTATIREMAYNAEEAAGSVESAGDKVSIGQKVVYQTLNRIGRLAEAVCTVTASVKILSVDSQRIDSMLDVIKNMAKQTSLLALNVVIGVA